MHKIEIDLGNNLLLITLSGLITGDEVDNIKKDVFNAIDKLSPNFDIISNMSQYRLANSDAIFMAEKIYAEISKLGVRNIIRVIGSSQNAVVQSAAATKNVKDYNVKYVSTMEEAYKVLELQP